MSGRILRPQLIKLLCKSYNYIFYYLLFSFLCSKVVGFVHGVLVKGNSRRRLPSVSLQYLFAAI